MAGHPDASYTFVPAILLIALCLIPAGSPAALDKSEQDYDLKLLGKYVFFDKISHPPRMACVTCHDPETGWTGSISGVNLHQVAITGANPHTVGNVKPPSNAYASFIAPFGNCGRGGLGGDNVCGGNFWNGRSEGRGDGALFSGAAKHIGEEVFQGLDLPQDVKDSYRSYFGPTSDQALNPMPNPVEQNITRKGVCEHVASAKYAELYESAWGAEIDCSDRAVAVSAADVDDPPEKAFDISFKRIMLAVGAWQHAAEVNSFSSKRDKALRAELACMDGNPRNDDPKVCNDADYYDSPGRFPLAGLTDQENLGHDLFYNTRPIPFVPRPPDGPAFNLPPFPDLPETNCAFCHTDNPGDDGTELEQLYADDAFHNIGTPANPELPAPKDPGVAGHMDDSVDPGFFKTPTLRNVDKRKGRGFIKAYTHNGWFKSLESLVHFYNTSAIGGETADEFGIVRCPEDVATEKQALANNCWPEPEWPGASPVLIGNLGMTAEQEAAVVAYLKTFTDTETPKPPRPYK